MNDSMILETFKQEVAETVEELASLLIRCEKEGTVGDHDRKTILRRLHNLKGASLLAGKKRSATIVHLLESLFERELLVDLAREVRFFDAVLDGLDVVARWASVPDGENQDSLRDCESVERRIAALDEEGSRDPLRVIAAQLPGVSEPTLAALNEHQENRLSGLARSSKQVLIVEAPCPSAQARPAARELLDTIRNLGELVSFRAGGITADRLIRFQALVASDLGREEVAARLGTRGATVRDARSKGAPAPASAGVSQPGRQVQGDGAAEPAAQPAAASEPLPPPAKGAAAPSVQQLTQHLKRKYISEFHEKVDKFSSLFERLEAEPGSRPLIDETFRFAHSLKGAAGTFGFPLLSRLGADLEDALSAVRSGRLQVTAPFCELLHDWVSTLDSVARRLASGTFDGPEEFEVSARLRQAIQSGGPSAGSRSASPEPAAPAAPFDRAPAAFPSEDRSAALFSRLRVGGEFPAAPSPWPARPPGTPDMPPRPMVAPESRCLPTEPPDAPVVPAKVKTPEPVAGQRATPASSPAPAQPEPRPDARTQSESIRVSLHKIDDIVNTAGELSNRKSRLQRLKRDLRAILDDLRVCQRQAVRGGEESAAAPGAKKARAPVAGQPRMVEGVLGRLAEQIDRLFESTEVLDAELAGLVDRLSEEALRMRMLPLRHIFQKYPRMVREIARSLGREVGLEIEGDETEIDMVILEQLDDPLVHMLRNCVDHGVEPPQVRERAGKARRGRICLKAYHQQGQIVIEVGDDGAGMSAEAIGAKAVASGLVTEERLREMPERDVLEFIFAPGFTTKHEVTEISGRGVGMDVVRANLSRLQGQIEIRSHPGEGTTFLLRLPLTLSIVQCVMLQDRNSAYCIPARSVREVLQVSRDRVEPVGNGLAILYHNAILPVVPLREILGSG
ncbi:MAG: Hpt domain-containing protein, partial [Candidatus Riflebacteria bacterium]|nr:Hpt domain-containing protein [Candidatus Riflebacteria bacterium]